MKFNHAYRGIQSLGDNLIHAFQYLSLASAKLTTSVLLEIAQDPNIEYIEPDGEVSISGIDTSIGAPSIQDPSNATPP